MEPMSGRRFVVTMAVDKYQSLPSDGQLHLPTADAERIIELLASSGYDLVLPGLGEYSSAEHVRMKLSGWSKDVALGGDDVVIFYFAGHGVVQDRDRHYLMCWSSQEDDLDATALPTEDLIRILTRTGLRNLLIILDTCYGGVGAADGVQVVLRTIARRFDANANASGVWVLSSARSRDEAEDGAFVDCFTAGLKDAHARTGQRQRYLDLSYLVEAVNHQFEQRDLSQRAELAAGVVTGVAPFLRNLAYAPNLPSTDTDLAAQRRIAAKGELHDHFGPRARGVDFDSEPGLYFSGRKRVIDELVKWLQDDNDDLGRIVTGKPGCGKSSVVGRIVAMSDPSYRQDLLREAHPAAASLPTRVVDAWVHARHKLLPEIVDRIAEDLDMAADSPGQLLRLVHQRASERPLVIVVDALDEAGAATDSGAKHEPRRIARELLRPLSEIPGVRLLVGTRHELVPNLGTELVVLDLDEPEYLGAHDIATYVTKVLLAESEPDIPTPYRDNPTLACLIGDAVAAKAAGVYLVARMTARSLRKADAPVDITVPGWQDTLPTEIDQAFEDYLDRYGPNRARVRALLTPLAFAEGQGLPRGRMWLSIAAGLANREFREEDIDWLLDEAGDYIAEVTDDGNSVYRLYHQSLSEHMRTTYASGAHIAQRRIVEAALPTIPTKPDGTIDWFSAHRYLRVHLSTHAAAAGLLGELVTQPGFLLVAEQLALLKAFAAATSDVNSAVRSTYEQAAHQLVESIPPAERAAYLQLSARRCSANDLADHIDQLDLKLPWRTQWAWWSPTGAHRQLIGHEEGLNAVTTGVMDGRAVAVTGSQDGTARVWDLITRRQLGDPLRPGTDHVTAVAICEIDDYIVLVTGGEDGSLRVWDLSTGKPLGQPLTSHTNGITSIAVQTVSGMTIAVSGSRDGTARVWDLSDPSHGIPVGIPFVEHRSAVNAVALTELDGVFVALTAGDDNRVHVWAVETQRRYGESLIGHTDWVLAVAVVDQLVVTGSKDGTIGLWDLSNRQQVGEPILAYHPAYGVRTLAVNTVNGVPVAVSASSNEATIWNLNTRRPIGQPLAGHHNVINAIACGVIDQTPIVITAGSDNTARIWDFAADQPLTGHTDDITCVSTASVNGRSLAVTGSADSTAIVWDLDLGVQDGPPLSAHKKAITAVIIGEIDDRSSIVTGGTDALVQCWDLSTRKPVGRELRAHTGPVTSLDLGVVDGTTVLVTGSRDGTVRLWNPVTSTAMSEPLLGHNDDVEQVMLSTKDNRPCVFARSRQLVTGWDLQTQKKLDFTMRRPDRETVLTLGHVDNRPVALIQSSDNSVMKWDINSERAIGEPLVGHTDFIRSAVIDPSGQVPIAVTSSRDKTVRIWDLHTGRKIGVLPREWNARPALATGHKDTEPIAVTLGTASIQGSNPIRLWSLRTFQQIGEPLCGVKIQATTLTLGTIGEKTTLVCGGDDGPIRVLDLYTGELTGPLLNGHWRRVRGSAVAELDRPIVITADDGTIRYWDVTEYREQSNFTHRQSHGGDLSGQLAVLQCDNLHLTITTAAENLQVWDLMTRALITELTGHTGAIRALAASTCDGVPTILTGSKDSTARLWDARNFEPIGTPLTGHHQDVNAVAFGIINNKMVAFTGDDGGDVRAWDPLTGSRLDLHLPKTRDWISTLAFGSIEGDPALAVGAADGTIILWSAQSLETMHEIQLHTTPTDIVIHPDGYLCIGTTMGIVALRFWSKE